MLCVNMVEIYSGMALSSKLSRVVVIAMNGSVSSRPHGKEVFPYSSDDVIGPEDARLGV